MSGPAANTRTRRQTSDNLLSLLFESEEGIQEEAQESENALGDVVNESQSNASALTTSSATTAYVEEGKMLGLCGSDLVNYVREEKERVERREERERERVERENGEEKERVERREERERERVERENERIHEREMRGLEVRSQTQASSSQSSMRDGGDSEGFKMRMPYLDDKDDIESYICQWERLAKLQGWKKETWATRLGTLLKGKARDVYVKLDDEEAGDYSCLKEALLHRFQLTAENYRVKFRSAKRQPSESYKEYVVKLKLWLGRWLELSGKDNTLAEFQDLILQEQFLQNTSLDLATFIRERKPDSVKRVAELAQTFEDARMHGNPKRTNNNTGETRSSEKIPNHHRDVHAKREMGNRNPFHAPRRDSDRKCYNCGSTDHFRRNCPKPPRAHANVNLVQVDAREDAKIVRGTNTKLCEKCEKVPFTQECTIRVNGHVTEAIRDTGATMVVVDAELVPEDKFTGKTRRVALATGEYTEMPVAQVHLDTPYFSAVTDVIVMKDGIHPVLVGNSRYENGERVSIPVYPVREVVAAVETRSQEEHAKKGVTPLKVSTGNVQRVKPEDVKRGQKEDPSLAKVRLLADRGEARGGTLYIWKKDVLYRHYEDKKGHNFKQLVVPKDLRNEVLRVAHDAPMAGHLGQRKTRERVWQGFYWPGIAGDIRRYCASCDVCQRTVHRGRVGKATLGKMPLIDTPFKRVAVDLIGPIKPMSESGKQYVLVVVDYATRYPEAVALKNIQTETVAEALWEMWTRLGIPDEILTDRGSQFVGSMMQEVNRLLSVRGLSTTPYHPQTNGLVEKFNSTLKHMLRKLTMEQPKLWDRFIPALLFAYREVPQESMGFSPFELLYGRTVKGPMQILHHIWTDEQLDEETRNAAVYVTDLRNRIDETCKIARENLGKSSARYAAAYNKKTKERVLSVGDQVLVLLPTKKNKLELAWKGPFLVEEKTSGLNYRIKVGKNSKLYHINLLKKYTARDSASHPREGGSDNDDGEEEVMVVVHEEEDDDASENEVWVARTLPTMTLKSKETYLDVKIDSSLTPHERREATQCCARRKRILTDLPLKTDLQECDVNLTSDKPVRVNQYPLPHSQVETVKKEIQEMTKMGVIEPSSSPYNAPIVLVKKKDDSIRFCVDYRKLNDATVFDAEPLADIEYIFSKIGKAKYYTKIDLSKGFWQVPMKQEDKHKTAFTTPAGQFQWTTMPFGLKNAGGIFSRMMRRLLEPLKGDDVHNFMDDILIATETWEQHVEALTAVLKRLDSANLSAKPSKCYIGFREVGFLGHRIGNGQSWPEEDKVEKIRKAVRPQTKKELRAFLGLTGYYRKFVPNYAVIALPLTDKTKKKEPEKVVWNDHCERAFGTLKSKLIEKPILQLPDDKADFTLRTDASDGGLGAVLMQDKGAGLQPVAYASKKLLGAEQRYATVEKECLAVVWGIRKFDRYLFGKKFTVETDHQPLQHLQRNKPTNGRLMRWALFLQQYAFSVKVIPGVENVGADYLSRATY